MRSTLYTEPAPDDESLSDSVSTADFARPETFHLISALQSEDAPLEEVQVSHLPEGLLRRYVLRARLRADMEQLEDGRWYAEVAMLPGVWADGDTEVSALQTLEEVIDGWLRLKIESGDHDIPKIEGIDLNVI